MPLTATIVVNGRCWFAFDLAINTIQLNIKQSLEQKMIKRGHLLKIELLLIQSKYVTECLNHLIRYQTGCDMAWEGDKDMVSLLGIISQEENEHEQVIEEHQVVSNLPPTKLKERGQTKRSLPTTLTFHFPSLGSRWVCAVVWVLQRF